jgi:hypothetical protein
MLTGAYALERLPEEWQEGLVEAFKPRLATVEINEV